MANRRMFSKTVTNSSKFMMMPPTAQNLYFHFGMNADDDGFCEHFSIMRMVEAKPDDLRILDARGFVKVFDESVLVILDWKENNYLRSDRYTPSKYLELYKEELRMLGSGTPVVYQMDTQDRLGKDRLGKDRLNKRENTPSVTEKVFSSKKDISESVLEEISKNYDVPIDFVKDCWDSAENWLLAKGQVRKDYRAFLVNWVKRERASLLLKTKNNSFKRGGVYDARTRA